MSVHINIRGNLNSMVSSCLPDFHGRTVSVEEG